MVRFGKAAVLSRTSVRDQPQQVGTALVRHAFLGLLGFGFTFGFLAPVVAGGRFLFSLYRLLSLGIRIICHIPARALEKQSGGRENLVDLSPAQHALPDRSVGDLLDHLELVVTGLALIFINRHECHLLLSGMTLRGTMIA